jgi:hypothetical protein
MRTNKLVKCVTIGCLLIGASMACATTLEREGSNVTAIRGLQIGSLVYDVKFCSWTTPGIYGDPPQFDFGSSEEAKAAVQVVIATLNTAGGVETVGDPCCPGGPPLGPIFRVGFAQRTVNIPLPLFLDDISVRFTEVWEGANQEPDTGSDVWVMPTDPDVFPSMDDGVFADFTVVDSSGNLPPLPEAGDSYIGAAYVPVTFNGTESTDPDGYIVSLIWDFGDDTSGVGEIPSHTYTSPGTYDVTLTAIDNYGAIALDVTVAVIN